MMSHLRSTRLQIEKFVYQKGTNVALYNAEHSKTYIVMQKSVYRYLFGDIKYIADYKDKLPFLMSLAKGKLNTTAQLFTQLSALLEVKKTGKELDFGSYLVWAGTQGGQAFLDKVGITIDGVFGLKDQRFIDYFNDYSKLLISNVDNYTKEWIANKIQEGKNNGLTPFQIQQSLIDDGKLISEIRAERIVITETAQAMKVIENEAARRLGIHSMIWRTSRDERVCPICLPLDGKEKEIGKLYEGGYDGPPAHVSCRCYEEEVIPDEFVIPDKVWLGD